MMSDQSQEQRDGQLDSLDQASVTTQNKIYQFVLVSEIFRIKTFREHQTKKNNIIRNLIKFAHFGSVVLFKF